MSVSLFPRPLHVVCSVHVIQKLSEADLNLKTKREGCLSEVALVLQ